MLDSLLKTKLIIIMKNWDKYVGEMVFSRTALTFGVSS